MLNSNYCDCVIGVKLWKVYIQRGRGRVRAMSERERNQRVEERWKGCEGEVNGKRDNEEAEKQWRISKRVEKEREG